MGATRFTDLFLRSLGPEQAGAEFRDAECRGLVARVSSAGVVSFSLPYRLGGRDSKRRRLPLGTFPEVGLAEARARAREAIGAISAGRDPAGERQERRRADAESAEFADLLRAYTAALKPGVWQDDVRRMLAKDVTPALGGVPIARLRRGDFVALLDAVRQRAPSTATHLRRVLHRVFTWGMERDLVAANPIAGIPAPPEVSRDRVLSRDELRAAWNGIADYPGTVSLVLLFELVTMQRGGEILTLSPSFVDGDWVTVPKRLTKGKRFDHRYFLTGTARAILAKASPRGGLFFPSDRGGGPMRKQAPARAARRIVERIDADPWTPHDLRRTATTLTCESGVDEAIVARVLSHSGGGVAPRVTRVYNRYRYDAEKRQALEAWERVLLSILAGDGAGSEPSEHLGSEPS